MVDRLRRDQVAELLRHFAAGLITNDDFEDRIHTILDDPPNLQDKVLWAVRELAWFFYDDLSTHTLTGKYALTRQERGDFARWILFLYSSQEYKWPEFSFVFPGGLFRNLITFGQCGRRAQRQFESAGDFGVWPFIRRHDMDTARLRPRLLAGAP
ncbi:MAG: DUF1707 domain-containing protein [Planctomycetota bacterium]|jgi:hypothetical protein